MTCAPKAAMTRQLLLLRADEMIQCPCFSKDALGSWMQLDY
jgi:hypothetical protein